MNPDLKISASFTPYPNEIQEALFTTNLSAQESRILHFIIRKTFGWHKATDQISQRQIEKHTGIDRRSVRKILERLKKRKILLNKPFVKGGRYIAATLGINPNVNKWLRVGAVQPPQGVGAKKSPGGRHTAPEGGRHTTPYKRNKTLYKRKKEGDEDDPSPTEVGSRGKSSSLTMKEVQELAYKIQKEMPLPGLMEACIEMEKQGARPDQINVRLMSAKLHGKKLIHQIKAITPEQLT
jgi:phage replication O-like protein O